MERGIADSLLQLLPRHQGPGALGEDMSQPQAHVSDTQCQATCSGFVLKSFGFSVR